MRRRLMYSLQLTRETPHRGSSMRSCALAKNETTPSRQKLLWVSAQAHHTSFGGMANAVRCTISICSMRNSNRCISSQLDRGRPILNETANVQPENEWMSEWEKRTDYRQFRMHLPFNCRKQCPSPCWRDVMWCDPYCLRVHIMSLNLCNNKFTHFISGKLNSTLPSPSSRAYWGAKHAVRTQAWLCNKLCRKLNGIKRTTILFAPQTRLIHSITFLVLSSAFCINNIYIIIAYLLCIYLHFLFRFFSPSVFAALCCVWMCHASFALRYLIHLWNIYCCWMTEWKMLCTDFRFAAAFAVVGMRSCLTRRVNDIIHVCRARNIVSQVHVYVNANKSEKSRTSSCWIIQ